MSLFALFSFPLAEQKWAADIAQDHTLRLQSAVLTESLKQTWFCVVKASVADHGPLFSLGSTRLSEVSENGIWYLGSLDDIIRSFDTFFFLSDDPDKPT